ncbi:unnamed protein product [Lactuca saligna]|uniref:MULE transposase domain-containing protein n=1 Tax=Lactuca saligna TaxID=75948 RepID=A0AA35ZS99_LACSI|nr:unnamed protein product [Lactuca saligna]
MESPNGMYLTVDFHYNKMFAPNPLVYLDPIRITYERLAEGIRRIDNDADYFEFIEDGYMAKNELRMNVYIDHQNEPIVDWADKEMLTGDEVSDLVYTFDKTVDDEFLNKCGKPILNSNQEVNDDDDVSDEDDEVVFPVFDENQEWDKMVPVLGMKFSNPLELKLCLTNYAVKMGMIYVKMEVDVMPDGETYFSKFYVCLKGLKDGCREGYRRVIGVDGCFLKGICRGQLLATIGRDANNHIYLVAWAVVVMENKETWKRFLDLLIDDIGMGVGHGLTIISDQHKVDRSCDAYENGVSESLNSVIETTRKKPLITMLKEIRIYVMERLCIYKTKGLHVSGHQATTVEEPTLGPFFFSFNSRCCRQRVCNCKYHHILLLLLLLWSFMMALLLGSSMLHYSHVCRPPFAVTPALPTFMEE